MKKKLVFCLLFFIFALCTPSLSAWVIASSIGNTIEKVEDPIYKNPIENSPTAPYICYNENTGVQYKSIDTACNNASSGNNIIVIPGTDGCNEINVDYNIIIPSGVSLYLPYLKTDSSYTWEATSTEIDDFTNSSYGDSSTAKVGTNRAILLNMLNGADITISSNANLYIGGQLKQIGVIGKYSEINLDEGSSIDCYGSLYCYGYIKENASTYKNSNQDAYKTYMDNSFDEGRLLKINSGGYLKSVMGIYDSKDSVLVNMVNNDPKVFPYNKFDFPNMQTYVQIDYGANFDGLVVIEPIEDDVNIQTSTVVSSNSSGDSIFFLNSGNVCFEYCPNKVETTSTTAVTKIYINGSLTQGSLNITVKVKNIPYTINTSEMFLPISHKLNIYINSAGAYTTNYQIKFLPSSLLKINSGGSCTINSDLVFYKSENASQILKYGTGYEDAQLINNGTLTIGSSGSIGATILTEMTDTSATTIFNCSADGLIGTCPEYGSDFVDITIVSEGYFDDETSETGKSIYQFVGGTTITSSSSGNQCWYGEKDDVCTLDIVVTDMGYTYSVLGYQIYIADDASGTTNVTEITSGLTSVAGTHNIVKNKYIKIDGKRYASAIFNDGTELSPTTWYQMTDDRTLTIVPNEGIKITWTSNSISGAGNTTYTFSESKSNSSNSFYEVATKDTNDSVIIAKNYYFKISATTGIGTSGALKVGSIEVTSGPSGLTSLDLNTAYLASTDFILKFTLETCLVEGTMITMADGSEKPIEQIVKGDLLKVFNHEDGSYDIAPVIFNDSDEINNYIIINLEFSNNKTIKVVSEHGFFDLDLMRYVYIDQYNYKEFIGHRYYCENNTIVKLNNAYLTTEETKVYSPVTEYHLNYFTEGVLSMPGGVTGIFNIFEYDDNLQYDQELMKQDIETYGLLTYEDFAELIPYEVYRMFPAQYFGVAIGKGILTWDMLESYIDRYLPLMS